MTLKEHREREFRKCIEKDEEKIAINVEDIFVEDSYPGPRLASYEDLTADFVVKMMEHMKG
jgi:hypothetical protein